MKVPFRYCRIRCDIEDRVCVLAARMFCLTARLVQSHLDNSEFLVVLENCSNIREQFSEICRQLEEHRSSHGC